MVSSIGRGLFWLCSRAGDVDGHTLELTAAPTRQSTICQHAFNSGAGESPLLTSVLRHSRSNHPGRETMHHGRSQEARGVWSVPEHERFIEAMALYPCGPWKLITDHVGTRSIKQVQTHAQKYQQKLMRHQRGLRKRKTKLTRPEHRVDETTLDQFTHKCIVRYAQRTTCTPADSSAAGGDEDEDEDSDNSVDEEKSTESPAPVSPCSPDLPLPLLGLTLAGVSAEDWAEMTEDITNDAAFMHLMVDVDPIEPIYRSALDRSHDWCESQFEDLLKPLELAGESAYSLDRLSIVL